MRFKKPVAHDPKTPKPRTINEARERIRATFAENNWTPDEQKRYAEIAGVGPKALDDCSPEEIRTIYRRMLDGRMILEKANENSRPF